MTDDRPLFAEGSIIRRVDSELVLLLGGPRALLMQLAHPMVARGVAEHSGFRADPFARLQRTLDATSTIVFGTESQARRAAGAVESVHRRVVGEGYRASDPELLLWVHATLVDTAMRIHARFLRPLQPHDAAEFYAQSMQVAELLGVPYDVQPPDVTAFRAYVRHQVATLEVSDDARRLARAVLDPKVPVFVSPGVALVRNLTAGLLPPPLRAGYRLPWDPARQAALTAATLAVRQALPLVPTQLRRVRIATG